MYVTFLINITIIIIMVVDAFSGDCKRKEVAVSLPGESSGPRLANLSLDRVPLGLVRFKMSGRDADMDRLKTDLVSVILNPCGNSSTAFI